MHTPVGTDAAGVPRRVELDAVPFRAQEDYQCGPAALAMALGAGGKAIEPAALRDQVYLPDRHGSLQLEMLAAGRRNGFVTIELKPEPAALFTEIAAGHPVIVLQNLAFDWYPVWHYAVAVGYDLDAQEITLRSGRERRLQLPLGTFEDTWRRGGHWAMLALPPGQLPASGTAADYVKAVARMEKAGQIYSARLAYRVALERWPDNLVALMGLGNTAYQVGDLEAAERAFRRAVDAHPGSSAAHNNLAQTLADLDRYDEAIAQAREAVGLGGPLEDVSMRTFESIVARTGRSKQE